MTKKVVGNYMGHEILVVNTWFSGAKLFIDGVEKAEDRSLFALNPRIPFLSAKFFIDETPHNVEVFVKTLFSFDAKICVDGRQIAGTVF